jgi:hypothetical protein
MRRMRSRAAPPSQNRAGRRPSVAHPPTLHGRVNSEFLVWRQLCEKRSAERQQPRRHNRAVRMRIASQAALPRLRLASRCSTSKVCQFFAKSRSAIAAQGAAGHQKSPGSAERSNLAEQHFADIKQERRPGLKSMSRSLRAKGLRRLNCAPSGEDATQFQSDSARTDSPVRIRYAQAASPVSTS